jgi:hypothetical protein
MFPTSRSLAGAERRHERAHGEAFTREGAVVIADRDDDAGNKTAATLREAAFGRLLTFQDGRELLRSLASAA